MSRTTPDVLANLDVAPTAPLPDRPRVWTVFAAFGSALVATIAFQVIVAVVILVWQTSQGKDVQAVAKELPGLLTLPSVFILLGLCSQIIIGLAALIPARLSPEPTRVRLGWLKPALPWWAYVVFPLSSLPLLAAGVVLAGLVAKVIPPDPSLRMLADRVTPAHVAPLVLFVALAPGFMEELLFRGYIQRRMLQRWSPAVAITVASLLFAVMHIGPHAIVGATLLGFWFGVIAWRTGSIWPTIACHAFVNGSWNLWNFGTKFVGLPSHSHPAVIASAVGVGAVAFVAAVRLLMAHRPAAADVAVQGGGDVRDTSAVAVAAK